MSDIDGLSFIVPKPYHWRFDPPWAIHEIIVNWLQIEVDPKAEEKMPILQQMVGFRNREVHDYVHAYLMEEMSKVALRMYGVPHEEGGMEWR